MNLDVSNADDEDASSCLAQAYFKLIKKKRGRRSKLIILEFVLNFKK